MKVKKENLQVGDSLEKKKKGQSWKGNGNEDDASRRPTRQRSPESDGLFLSRSAKDEMLEMREELKYI